MNKDLSTDTPSSSSRPSQSVSNIQSEGVILGPDGKPCRACTDFKSWSKQMQGDVAGRSVPSMASAVSCSSCTFLCLYKQEQMRLRECYIIKINASLGIHVYILLTYI